MLFFSFSEHIQQIMTLEESVQHVVMTAIQEVRSAHTYFPRSTSTLKNIKNKQFKNAVRIEQVMQAFPP